MVGIPVMVTLIGTVQAETVTVVVALPDLPFALPVTVITVVPTAIGVTDPDCETIATPPFEEFHTSVAFDGETVKPDPSGNAADVHPFPNWSESVVGRPLTETSGGGGGVVPQRTTLTYFSTNFVGVIETDTAVRPTLRPVT